MRQSFLLLSFLFISILSFAGDPVYPVSTIPASLLKDADIVKRKEEVQFEIVNTHETIIRRLYALTILNESGLDAAQFVAGYDKLRKIQSIEGSLYDAKGQLLKKLKSKDIQDYSNVSDISIMEDSRVKVHSFNYKEYPFTVEYEVVIKSATTYSFPDWIPVSDQHLSVENSSFTVNCPADYTVRYKAFLYNGEPVIATTNGKKSMQWKASNLGAITRPFASPNWAELTTSVHLAPSQFEMEGFKGNGNSWQEFGRFQLALNENRDKLPEAVLQKVSELTKGVTDNKEKVKRLYNFLQQNTRYISIQLGIGGLQPFDAAYVAQKGYGDCKALSNYMYSLLKAAGIPSYHALVNGGTAADDRFMIEELPSHQFNHMILCVPMAKDSMWLECTSQTDPAGYMGRFTGNRKALLITENGGQLVSTPRYGLNENLQLRVVKGKLDEEGNLQMKVASSYRATQQDGISSMIKKLSKDKLKKILNEELGLASYEVNDFKYASKTEALPEVDETLDVSVNNYATITGKRIFITPNILNRTSSQLIDEERNFDLQFSSEYRDVDSVEIELPAGYTVEALPQAVALKTPFGSYKASFHWRNNTLFYTREREQYAGRFPPSAYKDVVTFFNAIYKADHNRLVLVKN